MCYWIFNTFASSKIRSGLPCISSGYISTTPAPIGLTFGEAWALKSQAQTWQTWLNFGACKCIQNSITHLTFWDEFVINKNWYTYWEFSEEFASITIDVSYCEYGTTANHNWTNHNTPLGYAILFYSEYLIQICRVFKFGSGFWIFE